MDYSDESNDHDHIIYYDSTLDRSIEPYRYIDFTEYIKSLKLCTRIDYGTSDTIRYSFNPAWDYIRRSTAVDGIHTLTPCNSKMGIWEIPCDDYHDFITAFYLPADFSTCTIVNNNNEVLTSLGECNVPIEQILKECKCVPIVSASDSLHVSTSYIHTPGTSEIYICGEKYIRYTPFSPCLPMRCLRRETIELIFDTPTFFYLECINLTKAGARTFDDRFSKDYHDYYNEQYYITVKVHGNTETKYIACSGNLMRVNHDTIDSWSTIKPERIDRQVQLNDSDSDSDDNDKLLCIPEYLIPNGVCSINYVKDDSLVHINYDSSSDDEPE